MLHILQRVQNYAARLILRFGRSEHITPVLYYLHWLSVELRVDYKMLLYTYKAFYEHAPPYICDMITKYKPRRQLISSDKCMLVVPKIRTKEYGACDDIMVHVMTLSICIYIYMCVCRIYIYIYDVWSWIYMDVVQQGTESTTRIYIVY